LCYEKKIVLKIDFFVQSFGKNVMVLGLKFVEFPPKIVEIAMFSRGPYALNSLL
jgi:hypothetical protein